METHGYEGPEQATRSDAEATVTDATRDDAPRPPFARGESLGRYVVLDTLGAGGMGIVLAAYDTTLDRRVALKLLHAHTSADPGNHARLLREAQALAKLSHPRVVSVYDVGELRGQVFIAMEFVDGPNLRQWLREKERTPAQILKVFRGAGKGLQAAHDAGIVHRDLKPDNILIGPNGKAYVTDFGLALEADVVPKSSSTRSSSAWSSSRLTETGAVMGTPAYMPIEQHAGLMTDHRSDQFSFCVSLFEALHGLRPFSGTNASELCLAIGRADLPTSPNTVARRVRHALARGLSPKAEDRFPSMRALLRALSPPTRSSRTWVFGGVGGLVLGAALVGLADPSSPPCASLGDRVLGVYGPQQREQLESAFAATGLPYAKASSVATTAALDAFATQWTSSAQEACLASERGEQSGAMLDLRMLCLDRGLLALSATVEILATIEPKELRRSAKIASGLPNLALCEDLEALPKLAILPATPEQAHDAETLLPIVDRIRVLVIADRQKEAQTLLDTHAQELERSTYPFVQTLHRTWQGRLLFSRREQATPEVLRQAHLLALEHGLDAQASRTATALGTWHSDKKQFDASIRWFESAGALARAAGSTRLQATVASTSAGVYSQAGRHDDAIARTQHALQLTEDDESYPPRARVELLLSHARALQYRDGERAGLEEIHEARALIGELDGDAPVIASIETKLSEFAMNRDDVAAALTHAEEAQRITELHYGRDSLRYAAALTNVAIPMKELGMVDDALGRLAEALDIFRGPSNYAPGTAQVLINMSVVLLVDGRDDQVRRRLDELTTLIHEAHFEGTELQALEFQLRASVERQDGEIERSRTHATQALKLLEKQFGEKHHRLADARTLLAYAELEAGEYDTARRLVERAREARTTVPADRALGSFVLARILWETEGASPSDRKQAVQLARSALADYEQSPPYVRHRAEVRAWIEAHENDVEPTP
ncbi:MAG: protein kinase domain-containing protein [Nannocystales bacterium]